MKLAHSKYQSKKPIDTDREKYITAFAKSLIVKWNNKKTKKEAPAVTEAKIF